MYNKGCASIFLTLFILSLHLDAVNAQGRIELMEYSLPERASFGRGAALLGNIALIGAPGPIDDSFAGVVHELTRQGNSWVLTDSLFPSGSGEGHSFGVSIDIDSTFAIIGMMGGNVNGEDSGTAYIYERTENEWIERAKLVPSDGQASDFFGRSVAISGEYAIVGAPGDFFGDTSGAAYVFHWQNREWSESAKLTRADGLPGDSFGSTVGIEGRNILVSAQFAGETQLEDTGKVFAYQLQENVWVELPDVLEIETSDLYDERFGRSLSIDSTFAIIGAHGIQDEDLGLAYISEFQNNAWVISDTLLVDNKYVRWVDVGLGRNYASVFPNYMNDPQRPFFFERIDGNWISLRSQLNGFVNGEISIYGDEVLVGTFYDLDTDPISAAAYIFKLSKSSPIISSNPITTVNLDELYTYQVEAEAFPAPTYQLVVAPEGMTMDSLNGLIEWLPTTPGEFDVEFIATNSTTSTDTQRFVVDVQGTAPEFITMPDTTATVYLFYTYKVQATGNPEPTLTLADNPEGMRIDPGKGEISWLPQEAGTYTVTVLAVNGVEPVATQQFEITVTNPPPIVISSTPDTIAVVDQEYFYRVQAAGNPSPQFMLLQAPQEMRIDSLSGLVSWLPTEEGLYDVELAAFNNIVPTNTQRFSIQVVRPTHAEEEATLPTTFEVSTAYPNPFSTRIDVQYSLPKTSGIQAIVYDALGRQVAILLNTLHSPGKYNLSWEPGDDMMPGMYFLRITTDYGESRVREMVKVN